MPELSIAERTSRHIQSIRARHDLLLAHANDEAGIDSRLASSCRSQGALAKLDAPDLAIHHMSLNTLKVVSTNYLNGGFEELDRLRRLVALRSNPKTGAERGAGETKGSSARSEVAELRSQRQRLVDSCAFMADQYNDLLTHYRRALDRLDKGRADPANERRLLDNHLQRFRGPKAQPMVLVGDTGRSDTDEAK